MPNRDTSLKADLLATAGSRLVILPMSALANISVQYLAIQSIGIERFGVLSLITSLPMLLPFLDLGMGTSLINAHASGDREQAKKQTLMAWSLLWVVSLVILIAVVVLQLAVGWEVILGADILFAGPVGPILFVVLAAVTVPLGIGARILVGLGRVAQVTQAQVLFPIVNLTLGLVAFTTHSDSLFIIGPAAGQASVAVVGFALAARCVGYAPKFWRRLSLRGSSQRRDVVRSAWPMLIISAGVALGLNSHRVVLAHLSTADELSTYSVAMVFFTPALSLVNQVLVNLWPYFARQRVTAGELDAHNGFWTVLRRGTLILIPYCSVFVLAGPQAYSFMTGAQTSIVLWISLGALMLTQGVQGIFGMYLTSPTGLQFQAACITVMVLLALVLMVILTPSLGAVGPVAAAVASVVVAQIVPGVWLIRSQAVRLRTANAQLVTQ